jgi:NAD+ synthase
MNVQDVAEKISSFLGKEFRERNKTKAILAFSGGIDSTTVAFLSKKAGLNLYAVILPYQGKGAEGEKIAKELNLPEDHIITIDIAPLVDEAIKEIGKKVNLDQVDKGNIMARSRMIIQYALARSLNGLILGTENLSEYYLGYFTLYGDQACDISPISGLFKTQVYELAEHLGTPKWVLEKEPSAGLWLGQTDEKEFGFSYKDADQIIYLAIIKKYPKEEIIKKGFDSELVNKVLARVKVFEYKRQDPPKPLL